MMDLVGLVSNCSVLWSPLRAQVVFVVPASVEAKHSSFGVEMPYETGVVRRWIDDKGFGFIEPESGGEEVFLLHITSLPADSHLWHLPPQ